ncbi:MAG TPA: DUF945 family protein, partial [Gammaproteobacteria bacterium]|nr:DUF945 family protein [Gammaproteobacteria bacterium]
MKKVAIYAVAAVALPLLALPPVLGMLTESQVRARIAALDASGVLKASLRTYERGWFRSRARMSIALTPQTIARLDGLGAALGLPPLSADLDRRAPIALEIAHGPLALLDGVYFGWSKIVARFDPAARNVASLERSLGVPYLFEFRGRTGFAGGVSFDATLPPVDIEAAGVHIVFSGAGVDGVFIGQRVVADSRLDGFALTSPPGAFTLRNLRAATNIELGSSNTAPGDATLSIEQLSIVDAARGAAPVLDAANVKIASKAGLDPNAMLLDLHATYDAGSVLLYETRVTEASVGVALDKVDIAALETYLKLSQSGGGGNDPAAEVGRALTHALAAGPSFVLDPLRFRVDGEPFTARVEVAANPAALPATSAVDLDNWLALLPALRVLATVDVSKKLARDMAMLAAEMRLADDQMSPEQRRLLADMQAGLMLATLIGQNMLVDAG